MVAIAIKVEGLDEAITDVEALLARLENLESAWNACAEVVRLAMEDAFQNEMAPDGEPWADLLPQTKLRRLPGKILQQTSALKNANFAHGSPEGVRFGNASPYAAPLFYGTLDGRTVGRPWLAVDPEGNLIEDPPPGSPAAAMFEEIVATIDDYIRGDEGAPNGPR